MYIRGGKRDLSARSGRERERAARAAVDHPEAGCSLYPFYSRLLPSDLYDSDAPSGSRFRGAHLPTTAKNIRPYTFHSPFFPLSSFYPSCIYCYHFLPERGRGELEERRKIFVFRRRSFRSCCEWRSMVEKRRRKVEASKSRVEVGFDRGWTSRAQQCGETDR